MIPIRYTQLFLFSAILILLTISCHKDPGKTIFQGYVTEFGTGTPIEGATIYISCETGPLFGESKTGLLDSLVTDDKGYFHIEYSNRDICGGVFLSASKEGYYVNTRIFTHSGLNDLDVVMDPEAWLNVITIPDGASHYSHIGIGGDFRFEASAHEGIRNNKFSTTGNRYKEIRWGPFHDPSLKFLDSIYVTAGDTVVHTIHY